LVEENDKLKKFLKAGDLSFHAGWSFLLLLLSLLFVNHFNFSSSLDGDSFDEGKERELVKSWEGEEGLEVKTQGEIQWEMEKSKKGPHLSFPPCPKCKGTSFLV